MSENSTKKLCNLTNKDFRELLKTHVVKQPEVPKETVREVIDPPNEKKKEKVKVKRYEKRREDPLTELLSRYRDRARERREGKNPDYMNVSDSMNQSGYHAVGHDLSSNVRLTERRRQLIQESKYLGGDMAHTHLVKGLDFALLNKVRSEIEARSKEEIEEEVPEKKNGFKTQLGRNICDNLFATKEEGRNPLFGPGKMSYVVDLLEEETDIPTTVVRSKVSHQETGSSMITSDAIIEKIRSVMHGLKENGKVKKMRKQEPQPEHVQEKKQEVKQEKEHKPTRTEIMLKKLSAEPTGYVECYPGHEAAMDAASDSDTEMPSNHHYHQEEEVAPRAAYQFGLKKSCGRRTRLSERGNRAVLDREWARIKDRLQL